MAQPTPYEREFNFSNQQAATPANPIPAPHLDAELNRVKRTTDEVLANLALFQNDEGEVAIGYDQLDPEIIGDIVAAGASPGAFDAAFEAAVPDSAALAAEITDGLATRQRQMVVDVADHGTATPNCTGVGTGTSVAAAVLAAFEYAKDTYGSGAKVVLAQGRYRWTGSITLDFEGLHDIEVDLSQATITPDIGARINLKCQNGIGCTVKFDLTSGGNFLGWGAPKPFGSTGFQTMDGDTLVADNGQVFAEFSGMENYTVRATAWSYGGRVVETRPRRDAGHPQTSAAKMTIIGTRDQHDFSKARTAQSLYAWGTPPMGNWGQIDRLTDDYSMYGPVWKNLNDIEFGSIDAAYNRNGPVFEGCVEVHGQYCYIGDLDAATGTGVHLQVVQSSTRISEFVNIVQVEILNQDKGVYVHGANQVHIGGIGYGGTGGTTLLDIEGVVNSTFVVDGYSGLQKIVHIHGSSTDKIEVTVRNQGTPTDDFVHIGSDVGGEVTLRTRLYAAASGKSLVKVDSSTALVYLFNSALIAGSGNCMDLPATNLVYLWGGRVTSSAAVFKNGYEAEEIAAVINLDNKHTGNIVSRSGGVSGGAGGAFGLGIATQTYGKYGVMAQWKGSLVSATGTELQGGMKGQIRRTGTAPQSLVDAIELSDTTTDNESFAIVLFKIGGSLVAKRVLVGAADSGGSGFKMLRVAN